MQRKKKDFEGKRERAVVEQVTLPISDTVPAPGNYTVGILNLHGQGLPVVNSTELIDSMGAGTAEDSASVLQAPVPGRGAGDTTTAREKRKNEQPKQ